MDTVKALDMIYLFRIEGEEGNAWKVAFQTDSSTDESREYTTDSTKDGNVKSAGNYEATHSLTSFLSKGDEKIREIKQLVREHNPRRLEVWEIDRSDIGEETVLNGDYSTDRVTSVGTSAGSEGNVEISIETEVDGTIVAGEVNVTPELLEILQKITDEQEFVQPIVAE